MHLEPTWSNQSAVSPTWHTNTSIRFWLNHACALCAVFLYWFLYQQSTSYEKEVTWVEMPSTTGSNCIKMMQLWISNWRMMWSRGQEWSVLARQPLKRHDNIARVSLLVLGQSTSIKYVIVTVVRYLVAPNAKAAKYHPCNSISCHQNYGSSNFMSNPYDPFRVFTSIPAAKSESKSTFMRYDCFHDHLLSSCKRLVPFTRRRLFALLLLTDCIQT